MDATTKQQPVIMGTIPGRPKNLGDITKGFNDPNEREKEPGVSIYPTEKEEVDIDKLARTRSYLTYVRDVCIIYK